MSASGPSCPTASPCWPSAQRYRFWLPGELYPYARDLCSGEDELSDIDKKYLKFGEAFEREFVGQGHYEDRQVCDSLDIGWRLLGILPKTELDRVDSAILDKYYREMK